MAYFDQLAGLNSLVACAQIQDASSLTGSEGSHWKRREVDCPAAPCLHSAGPDFLREADSADLSSGTEAPLATC